LIGIDPCVGFQNYLHCIILPLGILLWLRWKLTFLLKTESLCEFCKSIFKIYHGLSKLSVDCLLLFNECMQCFLKISSRKGSIRRYISKKILEIMMCLKRWLWSLYIIVITFPTKICVISPTRVVYLRVWVMIGPLESVQSMGLFMEAFLERRQIWTVIGWVFIGFTDSTHNVLNRF